MRIIIAVLVLLFSAVSFASAQGLPVEFGSSLNPVGSGARAMGMGGAFISVADDATAASWNPAGLIQLEKPEVSAVYSLFKREQQYHSQSHPEMNTGNEMYANGLNYASAVYPFVAFNRNVTVSLNFQRLYEMNKTYKFRYIIDDPLTTLDHNFSFDQSGYLYALSPAMAVQIKPGLYIGGTLNLWGNYLGRNGWSNSIRSNALGHIKPSNTDYRLKIDFNDDYSFKGVNGHLGLLWNISGPFTIGAVYKSSFKGDIRHKGRYYEAIHGPGLNFESSWTSDEELDMRIPPSYGIGLSYRHSDAWTVALDLYRTEWSRFWMTDSNGKKVNPLTGKSLSDGRPVDTTQIRLGTEYLFIREQSVIPVRFGLFYDPEPATGKTDEYYGFSMGTGYATERIAFDIAYQFRMGNFLDSDVGVIKNTTADVRQHSVLMSLIYYFK